MIGSRAFHKAFYDTLVGWQEGRTDSRSAQSENVYASYFRWCSDEHFFNEYFQFVTYATTF